MKVLILLLLLCTTAQADWLCTEEASQREGDTVKSCGIGVGHNESDARFAALMNAKKEFYSVCQASSDCNGHAVTAQPMRTECTVHDGLITCFRLVNFVIQPYLLHSQEQSGYAGYQINIGDHLYWNGQRFVSR